MSLKKQPLRLVSNASTSVSKIQQYLYLQFASQNYKTQHIETSVHHGTNVKQAFHMLAENLIFSHNIFQPGQEVFSINVVTGY